MARTYTRKTAAALKAGASKRAPAKPNKFFPREVPPTNLPRLVRDYTPTQQEACIEWLSQLTLEDLRQRQSLMNEQIEMAFEQAKRPGNPRGEETLQECQDRAEQLRRAILRWLSNQED